MNDPASGPCIVTDEEFDHAFTGVVITFQPTAEWKSRGRRPRLLPSLLGRIAGAKAAIVFLVLAGSCWCCPLRSLRSSAWSSSTRFWSGARRIGCRALLLGMALTALLRSALTALQRTYLLKLFMKLGVTMSSNFMWHALRLPVAFYFSRMPGDLAGRIRSTTRWRPRSPVAFRAWCSTCCWSPFYGAFMAVPRPLAHVHRLGHDGGPSVPLAATSRMQSQSRPPRGARRGKLAGVAAGGLQMIETSRPPAPNPSSSRSGPATRPSWWAFSRPLRGASNGS